MDAQPVSPVPSRHGFVYFPDTLHYRLKDLEQWLPVLQEVGAGWLVLQASAERAIPEPFLAGLLQAGIQPVLHFPLPLGSPAPADQLGTLLDAYGRWGVRYVCFFDRPNCRASWQPAAWARVELVERFLDQFQPLAERALQAGLAPVFPPLEPGGDYWDLAFLQAALSGLVRRSGARLARSLVLGAYGWCRGRSLNWGAGGPERWQMPRPYHPASAVQVQDHQGFRAFEWYLAAAQQSLGRRPAVILLGAGCRPEDDATGQQPVDWLAHAQANLAIARLLAGESSPEEAMEPLPAELLALNFWLLAAASDDPAAAAAWFQPDGSRLPAADALRGWMAARRPPVVEVEKPGSAFAELQSAPPDELAPAAPAPVEPRMDSSPGPRAIAHYVLLPLYAWGAPDWDLAALQPILDESHPTIGFSLVEASLAGRVTVLGGLGAISDDALDMLRRAGCQVERILDTVVSGADGTLVAT